MNERKYKVAVVGATGLVGQEMRKILEERNFPLKELKLLASERSAGKKLEFRKEELEVEELKEDSFKDIEIALFSIGADLSKKFSPQAVKEGAVVVDNSSAWRMDPEVPLVVPEVNPQAVKKHKGIIANPNCSTIQMVVALKPLHERARIKRIVVSSYQSVSGWGKEAMEELDNQTRDIVGGKTPRVNRDVLPRRIAFNVIPHIDVFAENAYSKEEIKMVEETRKIMGVPSLAITATCVRVPVFISHAEAVNIETEEKLSAEEARDLLSRAPGVKVIDDLKKSEYPLPIEAAGKDEVFVGRIRKDESIPKGLNLWIVSDNLRKGAALNTIQIAELMLKENLIS
jgi:aspartate-semialdehyde dehydrogenase